MTKFQEPEICDPRTLEPGDQVGMCGSGGDVLRLVVGDLPEDPIWVDLLNHPGQTPDIGGWPVPAGATALQLGSGNGGTWKVMPLPAVLARRRIV